MVTTMARPDVRRPPVAAAARDLLGTARHDLETAMTTTVATERYAAAHLAALRTAAAVLAVRTRPDSTTRGRPRTVTGRCRSGRMAWRAFPCAPRSAWRKERTSP